MIIYNALFAILCFAFIFKSPIHKKTSKYFFYFCVFLLSSIRFETGTDWKSYFNIFCSSNYTEARDILFVILVETVSTITNNYIFFQAIIILIILILINKILKNNQIGPFGSIYLFSSNIFLIAPTRQTLATIFFLYGISLWSIYRRRLYLLSSSLFHWGLIPFTLFKWKYRYLISPIIYTFIVIIIGYFYFLDKILFYSTQYMLLEHAKVRSLSLGDFFRIVILIVYLFKGLKKDFFFWLLVVGTIVGLLLVGSPDSFSRILFPTYFIDFVLLDRIFKRVILFKNRETNKAVLFILMIFLGYVKLIQGIENYPEEFKPYQYEINCTCP